MIGCAKRSGQGRVRLVAVLVAVTVLGAACSDDQPGTARGTDRPEASTTTPRLAGAAPVELAALGVDPATQERCDPIGGPCLLPWPNDHFTVADDTSETGRRLAIAPDSLPANVAGVHIDPTDQNRGDGWSPGSALMAEVADLDATASKLPGIERIESSVDDVSPIVVVDATTSARVAFWAELDSNADAGTQPVLLIHPARNFLDGHRVVVGLRDLVSASGDPIDPTKAFAAYRDGQRTTDETFERRRASMERNFDDLAAIGVDRADLQLAWDFTVASTKSMAGRLLALRDGALAELGTAAPVFRVDTVTENPDNGTRRRVDGSFDVPLYLTKGGAPGGSFDLDADGQPTRQAGTFTAAFRCEIPSQAETAPVRTALYGHGLLGDLGEVEGGLVQTMSQRHGLAYCATNWYGMTEEDIFQVATALGDLSAFPPVVDRLQQGILAFMFLGRLIRNPEGFATNDAFRFGDHAALATDQLYFDGNSQGAILGGALTAVSPDLTTSVLAEAGMNYTMLLDRSVDFDEYLQAVYQPAYPSRYDRMIGIAAVQLLWDRGETNGYANHLGDDRLEGSAKAPILLLGAVGDHQVSEYSLRVEARTLGIPAHVPAAKKGRVVEGDPTWGIDAIESYPHNGSAYVLWDTGSPSSPAENLPPREGHDPHDDTPKIDAVMALKDQFFQTDPKIDDPCDGRACIAPVPD